jgi:hypothetical protein
MSSSVSSRHPCNPSKMAIAMSAAAHRAPRSFRPGEVIDVRLQGVQDPCLPGIDGHRPAGAQRPQPGRDLVGELLIVFHDRAAWT